MSKLSAKDMTSGDRRDKRHSGHESADSTEPTAPKASTERGPPSVSRACSVRRSRARSTARRARSISAVVPHSQWTHEWIDQRYGNLGARPDPCQWAWDLN
jgi:hypothetical protein